MLTHGVSMLVPRPKGNWELKAFLQICGLDTPSTNIRGYSTTSD